MHGVPMSRQASYGTRAYLTDAEFSARARQRENARKVDDARTGTFRNEEGTREFGYTSMVIDPPDGRVPATVPAARTRRQVTGTFGSGPWERSRISPSTIAASPAASSARSRRPSTAMAFASSSRRMR
jgi:hypothetical protein